ncbi:Uncharacterized membrane protein [Kaistia soli DSM 19436]|uniref:Uncharacterized membrane protein n=1 Tax=Kaistia soli DSM 19436 TaxID=1122133 RepID=A0A1M5GLH3_9HYPH|nr:DUF2189 domain-containing protein [Kaistia soli]SHG04584.1 Uncharacterized membrane protein [Kaistia soli DSM 19436]
MALSNVMTGSVADREIPVIRRIGFQDIAAALREGLDDFLAMPSHAFFLVIIYPVLGLVLGRVVYGTAVLPLLFPLMAGFALLGPIAALGLYELSRRREQKLDTAAHHVLDIRHAPSFGAIIALGLLLMVIFLCWLATAQAIYVGTFGYAAAAAMPDFLNRVFTTPEGWTLIIMGNLVGFLFALLVLAISAVSFPLLLDRDVGAATAMLTSFKAVVANPGPMALWGLIVAVLLVLGTLPFFLGLAVVLPVLGHATWHLYRRVVV